jgi:hypothetical protein
MRVSRLWLLLFVSQSSYPVRDPFRRASGERSLRCIGIGAIHSSNEQYSKGQCLKERFALLCIDAFCYTVFKEDTVEGYRVTRIFDSAVMLADNQGIEKILLLK